MIATTTPTVDTMSDLEPITPQEAVDLYLQHREPDVSRKTLYNYTSLLRRFTEWCDEVDLDNLNDLTGRNLHQYRSWRASKVNVVTLRGELARFRVFLEFCATIDAVEDGMRERVLLPDVDPEDAARDEQLDEDRAFAVLDYLNRFDYAGREHVAIAILWHTGIRLGTLRAIDIPDFDPENACIDIQHRPETDTPLKNGKAAQRSIAVGKRYCQIIQDYISEKRIHAVDEYGRQPLITSQHGRLSAGAIRNAVYRMTRPCMVRECPHDRDPETCEAMTHDMASRCPSSRSPHGIRRGSITASLRHDTPEQAVQDRMNVSEGVLEQHYDERTEREKMETRRQFLWEDE